MLKLEIILFLKSILFKLSVTMSFIGKVILITGGSGGVGAACALHFAKKGAFLALVGRNAEKFQKVVDKIKESGIEMEPLIIYADVSTEAQRIVDETIEKFGSLDVLINNAGYVWILSMS